MPDWTTDLIRIAGAAILVLINGFFVAVEFALVRLRESRLDELVSKEKSFAATTQWLQRRLDASLSACQLGITMASLGLGWVGEPAVAHLIRPAILAIGVQSDLWLHGTAFAVSFTAITAAHLVVGEQFPKILALRRPEPVALVGAVPLKIFFYLSYPLMKGLNASTSFLLRMFGVEGSSSHDAVPTEEELRSLLSLARSHGHLSRSEHRLINAVFEFDDLICRKVMRPRGEVVYLDSEAPLAENLQKARESGFSRYPVCEGSLDRLLGVVHVKSMLNLDHKAEDGVLRTLLREPRFIPENMSISRLLRHFQSLHQHLAFVADEHGTIIGIVTMEDILEQIVGPVEDEFDRSAPDIVAEGPGNYIVKGGVSLQRIDRELDLGLAESEADTLAGLMMIESGKTPEAGDKLELEKATFEIVTAEGPRTKMIRIVLKDSNASGEQKQGDGASGGN